MRLLLWPLGAPWMTCLLRSGDLVADSLLELLAVIGVLERAGLLVLRLLADLCRKSNVKKIQKVVYRAQGISSVKGSVCCVLRFAFPRFSPPLPPGVLISKQHTH